jgi:hypothetical protein
MATHNGDVSLWRTIARCVARVVDDDENLRNAAALSQVNVDSFP